MMLAYPQWLSLSLLIPLLMVLLGWSVRKRGKLLSQLMAIGMIEMLVGQHVRRRRIAQAVAALGAVSLMVLAALGPRMGFSWQQQKMEGVTLMVILDVSRSMDAQDVKPSRMEVARRELKDMASLLRGDAVGLVIFAAGSYLRLPPTVDYDTFSWALDDSSTATITAQGTSLAGAIETATEALQRAEGSGKALVVVSDGEGHDESAEMDKALAKVKEAGVHIYTLGIGTPDGAPIPVEGGGFKKDASGNVVVSKLDEDRLRSLAEGTGGAYVRAVASEEDVRLIYEQEIRGKLQAAERGVRDRKIWHERYQWPLALGFFSAIYASLMGIGKRFRHAAGAALLLIAFLPGLAHAGAAEDGLTAWKAGHWTDAVPLLGQARVEDPNNQEITQALAESLYRSGRYREAEALYRSLAAQSKNAGEQAVHTYNAGNAAYKAGRLDDALADYQEAAQQDPKLAPAQQNAKVVQQEIAMRQKKEQEQKDQQNQQDQQNQDQQNQEGQQNQDQQSQNGQQQQQQGQQQQQSAQQSQQQQGQQQQQQGQQNQQQGQEQPSQQGQQAQQAQGQDPNSTETPQNLDPTQNGEMAGTENTDPNKMSAADAARLVESVPDGRPQAVVGGASDGRDW